MRRTWYRPKRKAELIRHLEQDHALDYGPGPVKIVGHRWTLEYLHIEHDGLHERRVRNVDEDARIEASLKEQYPDYPFPDSIADIAAEHGVTEAQLRQALRESHPDAGVAEVILAAQEIAEDERDVDDEDGPPPDLNPEGDPYRNGAFG